MNSRRWKYKHFTLFKDNMEHDFSNVSVITSLKVSNSVLWKLKVQRYKFKDFEQLLVLLSMNGEGWQFYVEVMLSLKESFDESKRMKKLYDYWDYGVNAYVRKQVHAGETLMDNGYTVILGSYTSWKNQFYDFYFFLFASNLTYSTKNIPILIYVVFGNNIYVLFTK